MPEYFKVSIPRDFKHEIDKILKEHPSLLYRTPSDFVIDAVRRRIEGIKGLDVGKEEMRG